MRPNYLFSGADAPVPKVNLDGPEQREDDQVERYPEGCKYAKLSWLGLKGLEGFPPFVCPGTG